MVAWIEPGCDEALEVEGLRPEARPLRDRLVGRQVEVERGAEPLRQQEDQRTDEDEADHRVAQAMAPAVLGGGRRCELGRLEGLGGRRVGAAGNRRRGRHRSSSRREAATRSTARVETSPAPDEEDPVEEEDAEHDRVAGVDVPHRTPSGSELPLAASTAIGSSPR